MRASASGSLAGDHVASTARRLGLVAAATAALHVVYLILYRTEWAAESHLVGILTGLVGVAVSIAAAGYLLSGQRAASRVAIVAVGYEIVLSFVLAMSQTWSVPYDAPTAQVSWVAVLIALFPFLIPASPRVILAASLASAATVPLALVLLFELGGRPWPDGSVIASFVLPAFLCAFLAWAPTSTLHRLGVAVERARRLGSYELVERLGQGGMGDVWRAKHRLLARPAAVKLIKPEMLGAENAASRAALIRRFEQEAQATASLDSVHTVELYDFGVSADGALFYVMELLHGVDVQQLVERFGPLPSGRVIHLLMQACDSLADAHSHGLIHRDIKPANLFVARKGGSCDFLKVLDFGLVKRWGAGDAGELADSLHDLARADTLAQHTAVGQIVGTPAFLAPEAALGEQAVDGRADLYALGCVGYWMLTGRAVFEETSAIAMAVAHVSKEPVPPSQRVDQPIDPALEQLVLECLHKDRERRP
ncbi:MAG TPA: serine/threonine-protein kinase, partial [Polyangiales bacterium]|nr:serine/threonine-protein kinase [Polyangiales bacterium]